MEQIIKIQYEIIQELEKARALNIKSGKVDIVKKNSLSGLRNSALGFFMALRCKDDSIMDWKSLVDKWYGYVFEFKNFDGHNHVQLITVVSEVGFLFNKSPDDEIKKYILNLGDDLDIFCRLPLEIWFDNLDLNTYEIPEEEDIEAKEYFILLKNLIERPEENLKHADQIYTDRETSENFISLWFGAGEINPYYLDPLVLCILKYNNANCYSDSFHWRAFRAFSEIMRE